MTIRVFQSFSSFGAELQWQPFDCFWFPDPKDGGESIMVRVLKETSPLEEDRRCGKEQGMEVLQRLGFSNPVSFNDVDLVSTRTLSI